jgi:hypothetical protein
MRIIAILMLIPLLGGYAFGQASRSSSDSSSKSSDNIGPCKADARWSNTNSSIAYSKQLQLPISVSLLTHVSKGTNCSNAEIRVTATYLTDTQEFICTGTIAQAMTASSESQTFNLEIRPFTQNDFLRWRNQPGTRGIQQGKPLACKNIDGSADVGDLDRSRATAIHVAVAVLPTGGGLAVIEALIRINP